MLFKFLSLQLIDFALKKLKLTIFYQFLTIMKGKLIANSSDLIF